VDIDEIEFYAKHCDKSSVLFLIVIVLGAPLIALPILLIT
jgi:hypothetical protein